MQIIEYPSKVVAFAQQWIQGNKVYDNSFEEGVNVYRHTVGEYLVKFGLYLDTKTTHFGYYKGAEMICVKCPAGNLHFTQPDDDVHMLGTWSTYVVKWFSINVRMDDVNVRYNTKDPYYIQSLTPDFKNRLEEKIKEVLKYEQDGGKILGVADININFTKPHQ
jgi:hypothetical protein